MSIHMYIYIYIHIHAFFVLCGLQYPCAPRVAKQTYLARCRYVLGNHQVRTYILPSTLALPLLVLKDTASHTGLKGHVQTFNIYIYICIYECIYIYMYTCKLPYVHM